MNEKFYLAKPMKILIFLVLFVNVTWTAIYAQEIPTSIMLHYEYKKAYSNLKTDTTNIGNILRHATALKTTSKDSAEILFNLAFLQSRQIHYYDGCVQALTGISRSYFYEGAYEKDIITLKQAVFFAQRASNKNLLPEIYVKLAASYSAGGQYGLSAYYNYKAIAEIVQNPSAQKLLPWAYSNMSNLWMLIGDTSLALEYIKKAENIANDSVQRGQVYVTLGNLYIMKNDFQRAFTYSNWALHTPHPQIQITANQIMARCYLQQNNPAKAIQHYQTALDLAKRVQDYNLEIAVHCTLGGAYYYLKDYNNAIKHLLITVNNKGIANTNADIVGTHNMLAEIYSIKKDYKNAFEHLQKYIMLHQQTLDTADLQIVRHEEIKYKTAEKEKAILLQENNLKQKNIWIISITLGSLLLIILLIAIYSISIHHQRFQKEKIHTLQQQQEIEQLKAMVKGEDKERARVGRELHDGIGGLLSAFAISFNSIGRGNEMLYNNEDYQRSVLLLDELTSVIRETSHNMIPEVLFYHSLPEAIRIFCDYVQNSKGDTLQIDIQSYGPFNLLDRDFTFSIYRTIQELIQNIIKHAYATHVIVQLIMKEKTLNITVEDNGVGFEVEKKVNGVGLLNLRTRIKSLNGQLTIESLKDSGTTVFIEFDIQDLKEAKA